MIRGARGCDAVVLVEAVRSMKRQERRWISLLYPHLHCTALARVERVRVRLRRGRAAPCTRRVERRVAGA